MDLAKRQSEENPVYYVQYAHARIASVIREAAVAGIEVPPTLESAHPERLVEVQEIEILQKLAEFPELVERAALALEPHRVVFYLLEIARAFHAYYNQHRILSGEPELTAARLALAESVGSVLAAGLTIVGASAPERM
jgi:arginyl-tRNA synthetase